MEAEEDSNILTKIFVRFQTRVLVQAAYDEIVRETLWMLLRAARYSQTTVHFSRRGSASSSSSSSFSSASPSPSLLSYSAPPFSQNWFPHCAPALPSQRNFHFMANTRLRAERADAKRTERCTPNTNARCAECGAALRRPRIIDFATHTACASMVRCNGLLPVT